MSGGVENSSKIKRKTNKLSVDNFDFTDLTMHRKQKSLIQQKVQRLLASNIFDTKRFSDSREKRDASREKRDERW